MPRFSIENAIPVFLFLAIGCMLAYFGTVQSFDAKAKQSWPQVEAIILKSEAIIVGIQGEGAMAHPEIKMIVEYSVKQTAYQAYLYAKDITKEGYIPSRYAVGKAVQVYFNPAKPSKAIFHLPSVTSSVIVVVIAFVPIVSAMLFIVFWVAMSFTHFKMFKARHYLKQAEQDAEQINQYIEQHKAAGRSIEPELLTEQRLLTQKVGKVQSLLARLQNQIDDLVPPPDEEKRECAKETINDCEVIKELSPVRPSFRLIIALSVIPLLLALAMTGWSPYYLITCQRNVDNTVDCKFQQLLFGFFDVGEAKIIADLREIDYEIKGKARSSKRGFLQLTGSSTKEIIAGRGAFTMKSIKQFLLNSDAPSLQVSDGHTMRSLYFPYMLTLFSLTCLVIVFEKFLPDKSVPFALGSLLASGIALLPYLYSIGVHSTGLIWWRLALAIVVTAGGIINVFWHSSSDD